MSYRRTAFHPSFVLLMAQRSPVGLRVESEVVLSQEPQKADMLVREEPNVPRDDSTATGFRPLWPLLRRYTLVEFKSKVAPFERPDLARLVGYAGQFLAARSVAFDELTLLLVVARTNLALRTTLEAAKVELETVSPGYARGWFGPLELVVVDLSEVSRAEQDALAGAFLRLPGPEDAAWDWAIRYMFTHLEANMANLEGYQDLLQELLSKLPPEQRLAGLGPEQRLAGLDPAERLAGLGPAERLAGLSAEELAALAETLRSRGVLPG